MIDLETLKLEKGAHHNCGEGQGPVCLLEAVACYAGNPFSDHPWTTSLVLAAFGRVINDAMPDDRRQELKQFIPRLVDTAGQPELDQRRAFMLTDWAVRTITPRAFRSASETLGAVGLAEQATTMEREAAKLEALSPVSTAQSAGSAAELAELAARSAAGSAAELAELAAGSARSAARSAAGSAAWSARSAAGSAELAAWSAQSAAWSAQSAAWSAQSAELAESEIWDECIRFFDVLIDLR